MTLAETLAVFAIDTPFEKIDRIAIDRAKMSLASTVASAAMGTGISSAQVIRQLELDDGGAPVATAWFTDRRLPPARAARVNAVYSDAAASDDSDMRSIAHIGTIVSATAVAIGEMTRAPGPALLAAMVLGYEIAGRIDETLTPGRMQRGFHGSVSTVFGAVVTAGRLLGLSHRQMAHAIALAATSIGGMAIAADTSCAREYHAGQAALSGVQAAFAALHGFEAELGVLELPRGFLSAMGAQDVESITTGLGQSWDIVSDMAIKLMPGAHPLHATAEAAAIAAQQASIDPRKIDEVLISAAVQWTGFRGEPHPRNFVDAAHSIAYFTAAAIVDGGFGWQHMDPRAPEKMADPLIALVQDKIRFDPDPPPLPDRFPHRHGATVTIRMADGTNHVGVCPHTRGVNGQGLVWDDVQAKYQVLFPMAGLPSDRLQQSFACIRHFEQCTEAGALTALLVRGDRVHA